MACCTSICNDSCYFIDIDELNNLLYGINKYINKEGDKKAAYLFHNFGECVYDQDIAEIALYKVLLLKYRDSMIQGYTQCLCENELQSILEKVREIVPEHYCGDTYSELTIDTSGQDSWLLDNPNCSGAAEWERLSYKICKGFGFDVNLTTQQKCNLTFDISKNLIPCELLYVVNVSIQACKLGYEIQRTTEECKLDWEILLERTSCNLSVNDYTKLVQQGLTYDMIYYIYNTGNTLSIDGNECCLTTTRGTEYTFSELDLRRIPTPLDLSIGNIVPPALDLEMYTSDYNLNKEQINNLTNGK